MTRRNPALGIPLARRHAGLKVETRLIRSRGFDPAKAPAITQPVDAVDVARKIVDSDRERVLALYLNTQNKVIGVQQVSIGAMAQALVPVDAILRTALLTGAAGFMVIHNHPSGAPEPSKADIALHTRLGEAARLLDLRLLDSLVVADGAWVSLTERGL